MVSSAFQGSATLPPITNMSILAVNSAQYGAIYICNGTRCLLIGGDDMITYSYSEGVGTITAKNSGWHRYLFIGN